MKVSTLSALLLVVVCCAFLAEVATAAKNDLSNIKNKKDVIQYIKAAENKVQAAKSIHQMLVDQGKDKLAKRFQKRIKAFFRRKQSKRRQERRKAKKEQEQA